MRADDELVSQAKSGYRPQITGSGQFGPNRLEAQVNIGPLNIPLKETAFPRQASVKITQSIFDGNRTTNQVRQAESQVLGSREALRDLELNTLQSAVTAYMDLLKDTATVQLNRNNVVVLEQQLRQTRDRFLQTEVTQTDVAQSEASLASGRANLSSARATLKAAIGTYEKTIGSKPNRLEPARPIDGLLPPTLETALAVAVLEHPEVQQALHSLDSAEAQVKIAEAALSPTLSAVGQALSGDDYLGLPKTRVYNLSAMGQLNVPIYTGGESYSAIRRAKEQVSQARLKVDTQRNNIRSNVVSAWAQLESARDNIRSIQLSVKAYEIALIGTREEAKVGQRTTLDVLQAQQSLLQARVNLISAQRDRVVDSYIVLASVGRLSAANLGLDVIHYDPTIHYAQVKDKWIGLRTPDGQ